MKRQHTTIPSWRRLLLIVFPPLAAVIFALALTMPALAAVQNDFSPISTEIFNQCNGELVSVSGTVHSTFFITSDGNGGFHFTLRANYVNVTGIGNQGNTYHVPAVQVFKTNVQVAAESTIEIFISFISQGSAPNFKSREEFHFTVNPDGTVTSERFLFTIECHG